MASLILNPKSKNWECSIKIDGKWTRRSTGTKSKKEATRIMREMELEESLIASGKKVRVKPHTLREYVDYFLKMKSQRVAKDSLALYKQKLGAFCDGIGGDTLIADVDARRIGAWLSELRTQVSAGTCNDHLVVVRMLLKQASKEDVVLKNYADAVDKFPETAPIKENAKVDEFKRMMEVATDEERGMLLVYWFSGMRQSDIRDENLKWSNITDGWLTYTVQKTGKVVRLPLHPQLAAWLDSRERDGEFIFKAAMWKREFLVKLLCQRAGIDRRGSKLDGAKSVTRFALTTHSLRHAFITNCFEAGLRVEVSKDLVGHARPKDVHSSVYTHVSPAKLVEGINALPAV